jgi:hypothetical protein
MNSLDAMLSRITITLGPHSRLGKIAGLVAVR